MSTDILPCRLFVVSLAVSLFQCAWVPPETLRSSTDSDVNVDFAELQNLALVLKSEVDFASTQNLESVDELDGGYMGISVDVQADVTTHGHRVENGVITVTWRLDNSSLAATTYTLRAESFTYPIFWTEGGSCFEKNTCAAQLE